MLFIMILLRVHFQHAILTYQGSASTLESRADVTSPAVRRARWRVAWRAVTRAVRRA